MAPALPVASSLPPNWVASAHPLGWVIDRLLTQAEPLLAASTDSATVTPA